MNRYPDAHAREQAERRRDHIRDGWDRRPTGRFTPDARPLEERRIENERNIGYTGRRDLYRERVRIALNLAPGSTWDLHWANGKPIATVRSPQARRPVFYRIEGDQDHPVPVPY